MDKKLSIVIPSFMETPADIFPLLASISTQVGFDFNGLEVIIVRDGEGGGPFEDSLFSIFPMLSISQLVLETNGGPGLARQVGLDKAQGEFVMFCDADDRLHNIGVLGALLREVETSGADMVVSSWLEEVKMDDGTFGYMTHVQDNTWMHGKMFRRSFLMDNGIRFHPELRVHEDSYFLSIAAGMANKIRLNTTVSYLWKWGANTITRRNQGEYSFESIPEFVRAIGLSHGELVKICPDRMPRLSAQFIIYLYFLTHRPEWLTPEHAQIRYRVEEALRNYLAWFGKWVNMADSATVAKLYTDERNKTFTGYIESETLTDWFSRIQKAKDGELL